jgi:predicted membrane channel-forming protein YqfA (hemolysin III family)
MVTSIALFQYQQNNAVEWQVSEEFKTELREWCSLLCFIVFGLLALILFLSLGGAFAILGPWAIFVGVKLHTKRSG